MPRAEQGAHVDYSAVTHTPAPKPVLRDSPTAAELRTGRLGARQPCPLVSKGAGVGSPGLLLPPALSISALQLLSCQRGLPALGSSSLCDPRQGSSIMPDLPLWLCAFTKASLALTFLSLFVLPSGPIVPHQLGLVRGGPGWQAGRAVSAGAPGVSPQTWGGVEGRGRAELDSSHISLPRGQSGTFSSTEQDKLQWAQR